MTAALLLPLEPATLPAAAADLDAPYIEPVSRRELLRQTSYVAHALARRQDAPLSLGDLAELIVDLVPLSNAQLQAAYDSRAAAARRLGLEVPDLRLVP